MCVLEREVRHPFDLERGLRYDESTGGDARSSFGLFDALNMILLNRYVAVRALSLFNAV